jgi:hypothetical protein
MRTLLHQVVVQRSYQIAGGRHMAVANNQNSKTRKK